MANSPNVSFTYNGRTIGGSSNESLPLIDWNMEFTYPSVIFTGIFRVMGASTSAVKDLIEDVEADLVEYSKDFSLDSSGVNFWTIDESDKGQAGYQCRTTLTLINDGEDHELRRTFLFRLVATRSADSDEDQGGRLNSQISVTTDQIGRETISINGVYTGVTGGNDAVTQYKARIAAWVTSVLTAIGGSQYKVEADQYQYDDENARVIFSSRRRLVWVPENESGGYEDGIREQSINITKTANWKLGVPGQRAVLFQANYGAVLDRNEVNYNGQQAFYADVILPNLFKLLNDQLAGTITLQNQTVNYAFDNSRVTVFVTGIMKNGDDTLMEFERGIRYELSTEKDIRHRWTGRNHDWTSFSPGPRIVAEVSVLESVLGPPRLNGIDRLVSGDPSTPLTINAGDLDQIHRPGYPPFGSRWVDRGGPAILSVPTDLPAGFSNILGGGRVNATQAGLPEDPAFYQIPVAQEDLDLSAQRQPHWILLGCTIGISSEFIGDSDSDNDNIAGYNAISMHSVVVIKSFWLWGIEKQLPNVRVDVVEASPLPTPDAEPQPSSPDVGLIIPTGGLPQDALGGQRSFLLPGGPL